MLRLIVILLIAALSAGCGRYAEVDEGQQASAWKSYQHAQTGLQSWDMHARAVLQLEGEIYHLGIRWQRNSSGYNLVLEAPFGQGVFRIDARPAALDPFVLRLPNGQRFMNSSTEALLDEVVGWSIPVSGLEYWVRGIPDPAGIYSHRFEDMRLKSIKQDGWNIDYLDYFENSELTPLPRRLKLERDKISLKLVIERWQAAEQNLVSDDIFPVFD